MGLIRFKSKQQRVLSDIQAGGFSLSIPKLVLAPQKSGKFLGYIVDLGANRLTVDPSRVLKLKATLVRLLASPRRVHVKVNRPYVVLPRQSACQVIPASIQA
jgi:hypothetical protein